MKWKISPLRRIALLGCFLLFIPALFGEANLLSVKRGKEGNKCWAIFTFDQKTHWVGISQKDGEKLSLYFSGTAGEKDGQTIQLDADNGKMITIKQMTKNPPFFRADLHYDGEEPLAVLKKNENLVIGLNDQRLLEGEMTGFDEPIQPPGRLVKVTPDYSGKKATTSLQFDGTYDWVGYVRPSVDEAFLLIRGAKLFTGDHDFTFEEGSLQAMKLSSQSDGDRGLKAAMYFAPLSSFSIVQKDENLMIQTPYVRASEPEKKEEMFAAVKQEESVPMTTAPTIPAVSEVPTEGNKEVEVETKPEKEESVQEEETLKVQETKEEKPEEVPIQKEELKDQIDWNRRVSFKFHSTPIKNALRLLASSNNLNMVIGEGVEGEVTMNLEDVTLKQALDKIVHMNNCDYIVEDNIITIKRVGVAFIGGRITKVYRLKYADAFNVASVVKKIATNDSLVEVFHPEFLNFLEAGKNRRETNKVAVQGIRRSSTLVVTDRPEKIKEVDVIIAELDRPPVQIMIESKLVELAPNSSDIIGIDWDKTLSTQLWNQTDIGSEPLNYSLINTGTDKLGDWKMGYLSAGQYSAVLDFLKSKTDSKLVSNPRILALDNEESSISVGTTVPVPQIQRGIGGSGDMVTFEYKEVNIQLNVTPHADEENKITMYVNPVIEEITGWVAYEEHRAPVTDKRSVNSIVTVMNGETVVIGGLIKTQKIETVKKVWLLGSLPLFGKLFQHKEVENKQTDLMIFITPTIVNMG